MPQHIVYLGMTAGQIRAIQVGFLRRIEIDWFGDQPKTTTSPMVRLIEKDLYLWEARAFCRVPWDYLPQYH